MWDVCGCGGCGVYICVVVGCRVMCVWCMVGADGGCGVVSYVLCRIGVWVGGVAAWNGLVQCGGCVEWNTRSSV